MKSLINVTYGKLNDSTLTFLWSMEAHVELLDTVIDQSNFMVGHEPRLSES